LPRFVASLSGGPLTCSQMIFRAIMAALEKTQCRVPSGWHAAVSITVRKAAK
jgi:hypothetical protein